MTEMHQISPSVMNKKLSSVSKLLASTLHNIKLT